MTALTEAGARPGAAAVAVSESRIRSHESGPSGRGGGPLTITVSGGIMAAPGEQTAQVPSCGLEDTPSQAAGPTRDPGRPWAAATGIILWPQIT